jgi:cyclopropane fatty-acyl-phospholipid synthase-like methyltransferase
MMTYNKTQLSPDVSFEKHVYHRDQFAHYLRWSHIVKEAKIGETVVDFGCGKGNMLEVFYRNKFKCKRFVGIDIRKQTIEAAKEKFAAVEWAEFYADDLIFPTLDYKQYQADKVCSFEVAEHVGKQNIDLFLTNMRDCGNENATYYISTPNYDEQVGAAGNHTYDSGDGRGVAIHEFAHAELQGHIEKYFTIEKKFGTFASITHYKHLLNDWQVQMFEALKAYYDSNMLSVIMAPFFPEQSRNTLWVLKRK